MADHRELEADLFGSSSDDEGPPQAGGSSAGGSDGEGQQQADAKATTAALFGSSDEEEEPPGPSHPVTAALGDDEDEDEVGRSPSPAPARGPPIVVEADLLDAPAQDTLRLVKLPNILGVEANPFDPDTFDAGAEMEIDARGFKRVRLRDMNCVRWRWAADEAGNTVRESNARFVRWSDGSLQLLVGDEVLDVKEHDTTNEHVYVYSRLPNLIQGQGQLAAKFTFQPASLQSNLHKQLRAATEKLHVRKQKVRATATVVDPKKAKAEQEKEEAERIRAREKLEERQAKTMRKFSVPRWRSSAPQTLNAGYLEEEEDGDVDEEGLAEDMRQAQRQRMLGGRGRYDEAEEAAAAARLAAAKAGPLPGGKRRRIEEDEDEDEDISGAEEEDEEEMKDFIVDEEDEEGGADEEDEPAAKRQAAAAAAGAVKQRRQVVLSDSEED